MTCEVAVRDSRAVARIINLAHRFTCRAVKVDAQELNGATSARFTFAGPTLSLTRLSGAIARLLEAEGTERLPLALLTPD